MDTPAGSGDHIPVLLDEVLSYLVQSKSGAYIDATFGRGGHSRALLAALNQQGRVFALDRDEQAAAVAQQWQQRDPRLHFQRGNFADLQRYVTAQQIAAVDGVLIDLGVSSPQLDDAERGFSFRQDGPLDMRMDTRDSLTAAQWLNQVDEQELADVLYQYADERRSRRIAKAIVRARPLSTTQQLAQIVEDALPRPPRSSVKRSSKHPATQTFQAVRMFINAELEQLRLGLAAAFAVLKEGGRLAVISFHSIEDRVVKRQFKVWSSPPDLPRRLPVTQTTAVPGRLVTSALRPSAQELDRNPRARSATLRVIEKCPTDHGGSRQGGLPNA